MGSPEKPAGIAPGHVVTAVALRGRVEHELVVSVEIGGKWYRLFDDNGTNISHIFELKNWSIDRLKLDDVLNLIDPGPVPPALERGDFDPPGFGPSD